MFWVEAMDLDYDSKSDHELEKSLVTAGHRDCPARKARARTTCRPNPAGSASGSRRGTHVQSAATRRHTNNPPPSTLSGPLQPSTGPMTTMLMCNLPSYFRTGASRPPTCPLSSPVNLARGRFIHFVHFIHCIPLALNRYRYSSLPVVGAA